MFKNYFTVAFRSFTRNRVFSAINILGLSIGISASVVIYLIVAYDFSFDKFEKNGDRIYRLVEKYTLKVSGQNHGSAATPDPFGKAVPNEVTGIDAVAAIRPGIVAKVSVPTGKADKKIVFNNQQHIAFTNADYFNLVGYTWLAGNSGTALQQPYKVVLTASNASLYFPGLSATDVIGKQLFFDDTVAATVTGVVKDITHNTVFDYKTFFSRVTLETTNLQPRFWDRWDHAESSLLYVRLSPGITTANINRQIAYLFKKYNKPTYEDAETRTFDLQPLSDVHFKSFYEGGGNSLADKSILYGLLAVAAFLLALACINFINLTTAQAAQRAKEIGIRKTMGGSKMQLATQFMSETFLLVLIATVILAGVTPLLLNAFAAFIPAGVQFNVVEQPGILLFLLLLTIVVSLLAGYYPAVVLSSYKPVLALKNQMAAGASQSRSAGLRKGLTVSQFVIAQVFIIATLLVGKQINYMLNRNIGMKKDAVVYITLNDARNESNKKNALVNMIKTLPGVAMVSLSMDPPSSSSTWIDAMKYDNGKKQVQTDVQVKIGDSNYIKLYQIKLLAGSNLTNNDSMGNILINETYLHALGFTNPHDIIGQFIDVYGKKRVVGVVQDFNQKSLHEAITPLLIVGGIVNEYTCNVALQPQIADGTGWKSTIDQIQKAYKAIYPGKDFDYAFLDEKMAAYYTAEQNVSALLMWATGLTIFISCLGLFGLVIYITNQRTKEIGIRKVVGATVAQLVALLSKDFLQLVITAFAIAVPFAWWAANTWLQSFAYKTALSWWVFLIGGMIMMMVAFLILGVRTFKAANANPVKSLRME
jgi:ABC-type antimicrobial peptide transport system permease subunit